MSTPTGANPSFVLQSINSVTFEDRPIPVLTSPTDVLIKIGITGICGSDVHYWQHGRIGPFIVTSPMVLGHESSGTVVSVGDSVTTLSPGDRVALEPGIPCRSCTFCKSGYYNLCTSMRFAATPPYDGSLAKYYKLPEDFCVKLPDHVSLEEGALIEPLAVGVHVCRQAEVKPGESVVVFGAGPVGLLCAAVARAFGAGKVVVVDVNTSRLEFAAGYAATGVFNATYSSDPQENAGKIVEEFGLGLGADKAIDASGAEQSIQAGIYVLRSGGTFVQAGMGREGVKFPIVEVAVKEVCVKGSFRYKEGDYKLAVQLVAEGKVDVKKLVTGRFDFGDAEKAFEQTKEGKGIKVLIKGPE
ncbi:chaperonin 10-like protein [Trichophaea hybrida]|nr:chaperonin 10-like protein [Trichophaea hybrida]